MSFNASSTRLAVSSSNRTIHIFDVSAGADGRRSGRRTNVGTGTTGPEGAAEGGGAEGAAATGGSASVGASGASGASASIASGLRTVVSLLPSRVTTRVQDYVDSDRSFASVRLRGGTGRSICALIPAGEGGVWAGGRGGSGVGPAESEESEPEEEILLVVTNEGILYSYSVDVVRGGECRLEQANSLLMDASGSQELGSEFFAPSQQARPVLAGQG